MHRVALTLPKSTIAIPRLFVIGDVNYVLDQLKERNSGILNLQGNEQFSIEEYKEELGLDPGGGFISEDPLEFSLGSDRFYVYPHKLNWVREMIEQSSEDIPGYYRIRLSNGPIAWYFYMTSEIKEALLCQLTSFEFAPGVKESRDEAKKIDDQLFQEGRYARGDATGGYYVARKEELNG